MSTATIIYSGNKVAGRVIGNAFVKHLYASRHFLRQPPAIASDTSALAQAEKLGAELVEVRELESGMVYRATIELMLDKGFKIDRGYGEQVALPLSNWEVTNK